MTKDYWIATNDKTGKPIVIVPIEKADNMFEAKKIANRYFKDKAINLHCRVGFKKGDKIESRTSLLDPVNCWMVWRYK